MSRQKIQGHRAGKKRSDRRWVAPDGAVWASRFEYQVFERLSNLGYPVRKCEAGGCDTFSYHTPVRGGYCTECGGNQCVQQRSYTPDLFISSNGGMDSKGNDSGGIYLETKGYFPASKRNLLRSFSTTGPKITLMFLAQRDLWVTKGKTRLSDYFTRYLKNIPFAVWDNQDLPREWSKIL